VTLLAAPLAIADTVLDWNRLQLDAIRIETTAPPLAARNLAMTHVAVFDAVNSIARTFEPYRSTFLADPIASPDAAAASAAHTILTSLYPSQRATFDAALASSLNALGPLGRDEGVALGRLAGQSVLEWRRADGASTSVPYIPGNDPGDWRRTPPFFRPPLLPQWALVTPFAMTDGAQFRPAGPPALTSLQYTLDFNQVKALGAADSTERTAEQTLLARFWSDFSYTVTPPGHWNEIAADVATAHTLSVVDQARLFALLNVALADAGIVAWDAKYVYDFWRPVTAIREADRDGNPETVADPNWDSLLPAPSFPEYISGHSTFSAAAAKVLAEFYGTDGMTFSVRSDSVPGVIRTYDSFAGAAEEIGLSRIYGGIHFLSADLDGLSAGEALGDYVARGFLRPIPEPGVGLLALLAVPLALGARRWLARDRG
jgi:membrane-associated phospholipid phosphatase